VGQGGRLAPKGFPLGQGTRGFRFFPGSTPGKGGAMVRAVLFGAAAALAVAAFGGHPLLALLVGEIMGVVTLAAAPREKR